MISEALHITAPAKVNLFLSVGAVAPDGYHPVETVLHALELADTVTVAPATRFEFSCSHDLGLPHELNLAHRAAMAMGARFGCEPHVAIAVEKRIPAGSGLGGASADAAAVIAGLVTLWGLDPLDPGVAEVARSLGADVPFFLVGGAARFTGRGDVLEHVLPAIHAPVVLVRPAEPVPTAEAYAAFDRGEPSPQPSPDAMDAALRSGDATAVAGRLFNAMTPSSSGLVPAIGSALGLVRARKGVIAAEMSGSGSAVFGICDGYGSALECAAYAREAGLWAVATRFSPHGCVVRLG